MPILAGYRELPAAARKFLFFTGINVVSWQCIAGQTLVLFGRAIDMPPAWVGLLLSFMPLSMLVVAFTAPLINSLGPRRLLTWGWLLRYLIAMSVFTMPWAMSAWGPRGAWYVLLFATLGFCLIRALGVGAWFPWLFELVPKGQQGAYFATETAIVQVVGIVLALAIANILAFGQGLHRFFLIYAVGVATGLLSLISLRRIPGGRGNPAVPALSSHFAAYRQALQDRSYILFAAMAFFGLVTITWLNAASVMYLRDALGYSEARIMYFIGAGSLAVALTVRFWGRHADRHGSSRAMIQLLACHALSAFGWFILLPGSAWTDWLAPPVVVGSTLFSATFLMVSSRSMLCRIREPGSVGYTNLWIIVISLAQGLPPIFAGKVIDLWQMAGFRVCFLVSGVVGILSTISLFFLPQEEGKPPAPALRDLVRADEPLRSLGRIFWYIFSMQDEKGDTRKRGQNYF